MPLLEHEPISGLGQTPPTPPSRLSRYSQIQGLLSPDNPIPERMLLKIQLCHQDTWRESLVLGFPSCFLEAPEL